MKIEHESNTVNGATSRVTKVNGKAAPGWRSVLVLTFAAIATVLVTILISPVILGAIAIALIVSLVVLLITGIFAPFAYLHRLVTGKWPSWFQVEVRREGERK